MVYVTNHYFDIPGNSYANLLWAPAYSDSAPHWLVDFVNWLGRELSNFCENEMGPFDNRVESPDISLTGARAIKAR
jgi:hypothetical protein